MTFVNYSDYIFKMISALVCVMKQLLLQHSQSFFCYLFKTFWLCFSAWLGVSGVSGHVRSQTKPAAACSAPWLGGAAGQPGKNLLCQSWEQNHTVATANSAVSKDSWAKLNHFPYKCSTESVCVCLSVSLTGTVFWRRRDTTITWKWTMLLSHVDRSQTPMKTPHENLLR